MVIWASLNEESGNMGRPTWENSAYRGHDYVGKVVRMAEKATIETTGISYGVVGEPYSFTLVANGEDDPDIQCGIQWSSNNAHPLPPGLRISWNGVITGTPTEVGTWVAEISTSNFYGNESKKFPITIYALPSEKADSSLNRATENSGVSGDGSSVDPFKVNAGKEFSLTAIGDRQEEIGHTPDDTRFIPADWKINAVSPSSFNNDLSTLADEVTDRTLSVQANEILSGTFSGNAPYILSSKISTQGDYEIEVTYREEVWDGSSWAATGTIDSKTFALVVNEAPVDPVDPPGPVNPEDGVNKNDPSALATTNDKLMVPLATTTALLLFSLGSAISLARKKRNAE